MTTRRLFRSLVASVAAATAVTLAAAPTQADHAGSAPGPVNADSTFGWGFEHTDYKFIGPLKPYWRIQGPGIVRNQHGMLTLNTARKGSVSATLDRPGHLVGRWEIRLRSRRYGTANANYAVRTELIPAGDRDQHCGARNIVLENYRLGAGTADFAIRNRPNLKFTASKGLVLTNDRWHTFAVEVTPKRISWFVDGHVISSELREAAFARVRFTVRFTMLAKGDRAMNPSRMQMDWLRYYTLRKPNQKSTAAPAPEQGTYADAC